MKTGIYDYLSSLLIIILTFGVIYIYYEFQSSIRPADYYSFISESNSIGHSKEEGRYKANYQLARIFRNPSISHFLIDSTIWVEKNMEKLYKSKSFEDRVFLKDSLCDDYLIHAEGLFKPNETNGSRFSEIYWLNKKDTLGFGRHRYAGQKISSHRDTIVLIRKNYEFVYQGEIWLVKE